VNAGPKGKILFTESGSTGGITKLQQILGVYWPPATRKRVNTFLDSCETVNPSHKVCHTALENYIESNKPIVFIGPYEHHSNEIMWRMTLCEVIEIPLGGDCSLDLEALEAAVSDPKYANRPKIGSFSAASNVSGLRTNIYEVAKILHKHGAIACFDFAACAPYVKIDMNHDSESYFDAIFLSPHKFLGGPGTSGILVFNQDIYCTKLPPTVAAGGTVDYVSPHKEEFIRDIEAREKPGTPGILQALRVAMVFQIKDKVGLKTIDTIENYYYDKFMSSFTEEQEIVFYGPTEATRKIPIVSFNIRHKDRFLHPKFVTRLLSDLFGIQTRAGCSCAGPYGHYLMNIGQKTSNLYRCAIANIGYSGVKPGWVRLNLHYAFDEDEVDYLIQAVKFVCKHGCKFLQLYNFDLKTGEWGYRDGFEEVKVKLDMDFAYSKEPFTHYQPDNALQMYNDALTNAEIEAEKLEEINEFQSFDKELTNLMYFYICNLR
jgi:selenocysteine lyase/cysteine desulfurase